MKEQLINFLPGSDADIPSGGGMTIGETHNERTDALDKAQVEALGLPPVPVDGSSDAFGALRAWLVQERGQFTGDRTHGSPTDPGYNGQVNVS